MTDWDVYNKYKKKEPPRKVYQCSMCRKMLNSSKFYISRGEARGLSWYCKDCTKLRNAASYKESGNSRSNKRKQKRAMRTDKSNE